MACETFQKVGKGRPSKTLVCIAGGCGKPYSEHRPSVKAIKARAKKAGKENPTAGTVAPSPTAETPAASSEASPPSVVTESGPEVEVVVQAENSDEAKAMALAEARANIASGLKVGDW